MAMVRDWVSVNKPFIVICQKDLTENLQIFSHPWEVHFKKNSRVGANIAEHTIVSLTEMVARNSPMQMNGTVPHLGSKLSVNWYFFGFLLAFIVVVDSLVTVWAIRSGPN